MTDSSSLIKVALFGGAGFLAYRYFLAPQTAGGSTSGGAAAGGGSGGGAAPREGASTGGGAAVAYNSLAALLDRMTKAAASAGWTSKSPDDWNYLATQQGGPDPMPDPIAVFNGRPAMTLAQYWAGMSAYLAREKGMTGLAIYAGLGRLAFRGGR